MLTAGERMVVGVTRIIGTQVGWVATIIIVVAIQPICMKMVSVLTLAGRQAQVVSRLDQAVNRLAQRLLVQRVIHLPPII